MMTKSVTEQIVLEWMDEYGEAGQVLSDLAEEMGSTLFEMAATYFETGSEEARKLALCESLGYDPWDVEWDSSDMMYGHGESFKVDGMEYVVLTDSEADEAWDASLDSYIEECLLPEIGSDHPLAMYFDEEKWKRDAKLDGRGHSLGHYDGCEHEVKLNGEWYAIYRTG